jgi:tetratricopeptide (TPR) repeat protein
MKNEDIALSCYKEALKIANHKDFPSLPNIYENIIEILKNKGNSEEVSVYKEQAEEVDESRYHISESTFTDQTFKNYEYQLKYNNNLASIERIDFLYQIGLHLMKTGDFDQALTSLSEAKELILKEPPSWHRFPQLLSTLFDNIAWLYLFRGEYLTALTMLKNAINIRSIFYSH